MGVDNQVRSREGSERAYPAAEPGVDDAGDVAGAGQVPLADRGGQGPGWVQAGELCRVEGAPEPFGLVAWLVLVARREGGQVQVAVSLVAGRGGLGGPDRVQDCQVIGVGRLSGAGIVRDWW